MKLKATLSVKILLLAFLNVVLLALVFLILVRVQFRMDLSSFLLAPARDRILSVSRLIGLQLPNSPRSSWDSSLEQYSAMYPSEFYLFDSGGEQLAGKPVKLPDSLVNEMRNERFRHNRGGPPPVGEGLAGVPHGEPPPPGPPPHGGPPPITVTRTTRPAQYWVNVPLGIPRQPHEPLHANLVWRFPSLWTNSFFFDYKPWAAVVLAIILISVACWLPLIRGLTRSIGQLTRATGQIAEGRFDTEIKTTRRDEIGSLSDSINRMARKLSDFVQGQRRFLSDIAHELCSPVARMQVALGILEQRAEGKQAEYVADVQEELQHMSGLINELLSFAKVEMHNAETELVPVNVAEAVQRVIEREAPTATPVRIEVPAHIAVLAKPEYLFRSISNLVRNSLRYAGDAGPITVAARNGRDRVSITVTDSGPGLPESELENVFKPFYRPELARQRDTGGSGLGLAIVKSCIESCGGTVECRNRLPHGLEVELRLQAAQP